MNSTAQSSESSAAINEECVNMKRAMHLLNRIEKILVPEMQRNPFSDKFSYYCRKAFRGEYFANIEIYRPSQASMKDINWDSVEADIHSEFYRIKGQDAIFPRKAQSEIDTEREKQEGEISRLRAKEILRSIQQRNGLPSIPGKWRKEPYASRVYDPIDSYVVTSTLGKDEADDLLRMLETPLDGFLGQAYNYDDHSLTEEWMVTFKGRE